jgi:hypothetical protein
MLEDALEAVQQPQIVLSDRLQDVSILYPRIRQLWLRSYGGQAGRQGSRELGSL